MVDKETASREAAEHAGAAEQHDGQVADLTCHPARQDQAHTHTQAACSSIGVNIIDVQL